MIRVGLISDTHGLLRPEAVAFLQGSDLIIHAGDICEQGVLDALQSIAPVTAVKGNNDWGEWADRLEEAENVQLGKFLIHVIHDLSQLAINPVAKGVRVVVSGHSHKPLAEERNGILFINPGSAGPRRFKLPISVGEIVIANELLTARTVELVVGK